MINLIEHVLGLTDKLMGSLLDWPFLLFVVVVWIMSRYRDQIGSMLDRRGAVGAGVVIKAVRREMEPVLTQVAGLGQAVSDLRYEVERLQALHAENRLSRVLEPVNQKIKTLQEAIARTQAHTEKMISKDVPDALSQERASVRGEIETVRQSVDQQAARIETRAAQEAVDRIGAQVEAARVELESVTKMLRDLQSHSEKLASKTSTEQLKQEIDSLAQDSVELKSSLARLDAATRSLSTELADRLDQEVGPVRGVLEGLQESVGRLGQGLEQAATRDVTDRLQSEVAPLTKELAALRETVGRFEAAINTTSQELGERLNKEVSPITLEISAVKSAVEHLDAQVASAASRDVTQQLQEDLVPLTTGLGEVKASVAGLEEKVLSAPKEIEARLAEELGRINPEVDALKAAVELLKSQPAAASTKGPGAPEPEGTGPKNDVLATIRKALTSSGRAGRRIDSLAKAAGISEDQALEILTSSGDFTLATNSKGQRTARLARR